jgi:Do/DeqQ family serine protease
MTFTARLRTTAVTAAAVVGLVGTGTLLHRGPQAAQAAPGIPTDGSLADVAERTVDSVVNISTTRTVAVGPAAFDPFYTDPNGFAGDPSERRATSMGSGVIVTGSGRILTNAHVIAQADPRDADSIRVTLKDGTELSAKVVGADPKSDLAVLQLEGRLPPLKPIAFGDSAAMRLGDLVLAVGDPFGIGQSVTMGIVSAKGRGSVGIEDYEDFIQTDAAVNPGNSGGALVNLRGELIGINTAIASKSGGYQGVSFAIPTNMARPIMDMLVKDGRVTRGYLGINIATVNAQIATSQKLGINRGVLVTAIQPDSPAAQAGLAEGDVVVALDGRPLRDASELRNQIAMGTVGAKVDLAVVRRGGGKQTVRATLAALPDPQGKPVVLRRARP